MARKTAKEAKVERTTWFLMLSVFLVASFDRSVSFPTWVVPLSLGVILLGSSIYQQFKRHWKVSPMSWIIAVLFLVVAGAFAFYGHFVQIDAMLVSLVLTVIHLMLGIVTNES